VNREFRVPRLAVELGELSSRRSKRLIKRIGPSRLGDQTEVRLDAEPGDAPTGTAENLFPAGLFRRNLGDLRFLGLSCRLGQLDAVNRKMLLLI